MREIDDEGIIEQIVKRHGEVINLREQPDVLIDILRRFGGTQYDAGLPGGLPPSPPGPHSHSFDPRTPISDEPGTPTPEPPAPTPDAPGEPGNPPHGPAQFGVGPTNADLMKEILRLSRTVEELQTRIGDRGGEFHA